MNIIGKNIKVLRQRNGWSQGEVAKRLKISIPAFSKIENGITDVNVSRLEQIAKLFETSSVQLICTDKENTSTGVSVEVNQLKKKLATQDEEIIGLQKKIIQLYEEIRN